MYALRILTGPQAGEIIKLDSGLNTVGRGETCKVKINSGSISKEHAEIEVAKNSISLRDKQSRNGTFVNGVLIKSQSLRIGDKVAFHDIFAEIIPFTNDAAKARTQSLSSKNTRAHKPKHTPLPEVSLQTLSFQEKLENYIQRVVLPPFIELTTKFEFKAVVGGILVSFAVLLTIISLFPMSEIIDESIEKESRARALTIARNLQTINAPGIVSGSDANLTTQPVDIEDGVAEAYIISQLDGSVMAPAAQAGSVPEEPFIEKARREKKELVEVISSRKIGAAVPILGMNQETGEATTRAYAVVLYDMGGLALDEKRTLSLFIQTLIIGLLLCFIFYSILSRLLDYPIFSLNRQIDEALKGNTSEAKISVHNSALQSLVTNINTLLSRVNGPSSDGGTINKSAEAENLVYLMSGPALAISPNLEIIAVNQGFETLVGTVGSQLNKQPLNVLANENLKASIVALVDSARADNSLVQTQSQLQDHLITLSCQSVWSNHGPTYFIVSILSTPNSIGSAS